MFIQNIIILATSLCSGEKSLFLKDRRSDKQGQIIKINVYIMILPACGWFYWPLINRKFCAISGASAWRLIYEVCKRQQDGQKILWSLIICKGQHGGQKGRRLSYVKLQLSIVHQQQSVPIHLKIGSEHFGILLQFETLRKWSVSIINANSQNWLVKIKKT